MSRKLFFSITLLSVLGFCEGGMACHFPPGYVKLSYVLLKSKQPATWTKKDYSNLIVPNYYYGYRTERNDGETKILTTDAKGKILDSTNFVNAMDCVDKIQAKSYALPEKATDGIKQFPSSLYIHSSRIYSYIYAVMKCSGLSNGAPVRQEFVDIATDYCHYNMGPSSIPSIFSTLKDDDNAYVNIIFGCVSGIPETVSGLESDSNCKGLINDIIQPNQKNQKRIEWREIQDPHDNSKKVRALFPVGTYKLSVQ